MDGSVIDAGNFNKDDNARCMTNQSDVGIMTYLEYLSMWASCNHDEVNEMDEEDWGLVSDNDVCVGHMVRLHTGE